MCACAGLAVGGGGACGVGAQAIHWPRTGTQLGFGGHRTPLQHSSARAVGGASQVSLGLRPPRRGQEGPDGGAMMSGFGITGNDPDLMPD